MRFVWKTLGFLAVLLVLLVGGLLLLPAERLGKLASDQLSAQLGRQVILGEARISLWPRAGIAVGNLTIANTGWAGAEPMLTARSAAFGLDPLAALQGRFAFDSITLDAPTLRLTTDAQGRANWRSDAVPPQADATAAGSQTAGQTSSQTSGRASPDISLASLSITDATLVLDTPDLSTRITDASLSLHWPDPTGPLEAEARLNKDGQPLNLSARIDRPRSLTLGGAVPMALSLDSPGGGLRFDGNAGLAPEAQGRVTLDLHDTARAAAALGQVGLALPPGLGQSIAGTLQLTLTRERQLAVREADLQLDGNHLTAAADVTLNGKPRVNARIEAETLDLSGLTGGEAENAASTDAGPAPAGWTTAAIDASGLGSFDGEIGLVSGGLTLGNMHFGQTRALMTLDNSRAAFELRELRGYDGLLTGQFVANNRGGLSVRANLSFGGVSLKPLLADALGLDRFSGPADGSLNLLGSGPSIAAIMSSLSGDGALRAGPGRIEGIDLQAALGGTASGGTTIFDEGTATFTVRDGVLRNDDLALSLPRLQARGEGHVDLGHQSLDYLITVLDAQARGGRGVALPVRVKGAWAAPTIRVDAARLIDQNLAEERDALEQKARDKVNDALQDKLGVTVDPGQSVEDALRDGLEKRARDGLLNLLNR